MTDADINFYFDPVCPFAWMTSKWVRMVAAQREYIVDWRFISIRLGQPRLRPAATREGGPADRAGGRA
jgi:predicted DsbA family dithiol-disulfide isomerase